MSPKNIPTNPDKMSKKKLAEFIVSQPPVIKATMANNKNTKVILIRLKPIAPSFLLGPVETSVAVAHISAADNASILDSRKPHSKLLYLIVYQLIFLQL